MKYVTGYTGFSGDSSLQSGNFMALKFSVTTGATVTVEIVGGSSGPVALDSDMNWVGRIASTTQSIKVVASKEGSDTVTKTYALSGITLEAAPAAE